MDETLTEIINYLRGHKLPSRLDDPRAWATYLETVVAPQLEQVKADQAGKKGKA